MKSILFIIIALAIIFSCSEKHADDKNSVIPSVLSNKKVVIVHSYHDSVGGVVRKNQNLLPVLEENQIEYEIIYLDTRRNPQEKFILNAAKETFEKIKKIDPDLVITYDDNAMKYLVSKYLKDSSIPIIFGGVDWDVSIYELPNKSNITGIISIDLVEQLLIHLKDIAKGTRIAWLGFQDLTAEKVETAYRDILKINFDSFYINSMQDWEINFFDIQNRYDILLINGSIANMKDWDLSSASQFAKENIKIPIGTVNNDLTGLCVIKLSRFEYEIGDWIGSAALRILKGEDPSNIPITYTKEGILSLNLELAEVLDIEFDPKLLKGAVIEGGF